MKKLIFAILLIGLFVTVDARDIKVERHKEVKDDQDYADVIESHSDGGLFSKAKSKLTCTGSGGAKCAWKIHPNTRPDLATGSGNPVQVDDLKDHADDEIGLNHLSGSYINNIVIDGEIWHRSVQWRSVDNDPNYNSTIKIVIEPAPTTP